MHIAADDSDEESEEEEYYEEEDDEFVEDSQRNRCSGEYIPDTEEDLPGLGQDVDGRVSGSNKLDRMGSFGKPLQECEEEDHGLEDDEQRKGVQFTGVDSISMATIKHHSDQTLAMPRTQLSLDCFDEGDGDLSDERKC